MPSFLSLPTPSGKQLLNSIGIFLSDLFPQIISGIRFNFNMLDTMLSAAACILLSIDHMCFALYC